MALFGGKKKEVKEKKSPSKTEGSSVVVVSVPKGNTHVLLSPRVTEKAAILSDSGVYVFAVTETATKTQIARAVTELFKVIPRKVRVVNTKGTRVMTRATGKKGMTRGHKKAYVFLKKGEKIELA